MLTVNICRALTDHQMFLSAPSHLIITTTLGRRQDRWCYFLNLLFIFLQIKELGSREIKWLAQAQRATRVIITNTYGYLTVPDAVRMNTFASPDKRWEVGSGCPHFTDGEVQGPARFANLLGVK